MLGGGLAFGALMLFTPRWLKRLEALDRPAAVKHRGLLAVVSSLPPSQGLGPEVAPYGPDAAGKAEVSGPTIGVPRFPGVFVDRSGRTTWGEEGWSGSGNRRMARKAQIFAISGRSISQDTPNHTPKCAG